MAINSYVAPISSASDADFRAWVSAIHAGFAAVGLVRTADTGQIDTTTVSRPAINTVAGYSMWRFNDALQTTAPIFFKIEFAASSVITTPRVWLTVGTETNGAGTIGGVICRARDSITSLSPPSAGSYPTYICHAAGFFGYVGHAGGTNLNPTPLVGLQSFAICRTCDASGAPTADGCVVYTYGGNSPASVQSSRFGTAPQVLALSGAGAYSLVPHAVTDSTINGVPRAYLHLHTQPEVSPVFGLCTVVTSEFPNGATFEAALVGTTPRTYLAVKLGIGYGAPHGLSAYSIAMLWE